MVEHAFSGFTALPAPKSPYEILGVRSGASRAEIEAAYGNAIEFWPRSAGQF
jgi:DnaJ-class molecular chaperone